MISTLAELLVIVFILTVCNFFVGYALFVWFTMAGHPVTPTQAMMTAIPLTWLGAWVVWRQ